ncbi:hypothetical protein GGP41_001155 [Bipolaris sorokiniana]|uniref:Uncharacterized protein n=1 Tax=Cochliobolus sativus TaxID=45130 RepID=A0A8H5ZBA7_COCSA|nr:hypothetical protein GGP41_001155 [Bipolaris sorokiniana]
MTKGPCPSLGPTAYRRVLRQQTSPSCLDQSFTSLQSSVMLNGFLRSAKVLPGMKGGPSVDAPAPDAWTRPTITSTTIQTYMP